MAKTEIKDNTVTEVTELTPTDYFDKLKGMKKYIDNEEILNEINICLELMKTPKMLGQKKMLEHLYHQMVIRIRESFAILNGYQLYVLRDDIVYYIDKIAKKTVKIIELENYVREIPDDVAYKIYSAKEKKYKLPITDKDEDENGTINVEGISDVIDKDIIEKEYPIFDDFYIVFTDYTGEAERTVEKEKRDKDPIVFGVIYHTNKDRVPTNRLYYIADWTDEYCDLTLDELCKQYKSKNNKNILINNLITNNKNDLKMVFKQQVEDYKLDK